MESVITINSRKKNVNLKDIAAVAGVSISTVSSVLRNNTNRIRVSETTREKILNIAKEMNYTLGVSSNRTLMNSSAGDGSKIIFIFWADDGISSSIDAFNAGINRYNQEHMRNYLYIVCPFQRGNLSALKNIIISENYDGAIFVGLLASDEEFLSTFCIHAPHVLFNRDNYNLNTVVLDNYSIGTEAAKCLIAHSPASIAFIETAPENRDRRRSIRRAAFLDYCSNVGYDIPPERKITTVQTPEASQQAIKQLLDNAPLPCGVFLTNVIQMNELTHYLLEKDLKLGIDILAVAYLDLPPYFASDFTLLSSPIESMSYDCLNIIDHLINNQAPDGLGKIYQGEIHYGISCPPITK